MLYQFSVVINFFQLVALLISPACQWPGRSFGRYAAGAFLEKIFGHGLTFL